VFGLGDWFINGAQAEYCVAKATALARKPASLYLRLYVTSGHPIPTAYGTHCACQVKFLMK
jgi:NADPH:quinone reductase-like Zn-dependent oxidoreductase